MESLVKYIPFLILLYGWYTTYLDFEEHEEQVVNLRENAIPGKKAKIRRMEKEINEINEFKGEIENYENQIKSYEEQFVDIKLKIPPLDDKTSILDELNNEARKINLQKVSFKPKYEKENNDGIYFTNGIEFSGHGTYLQFLILFEKLALAERVYNISELRVKSSNDKHTGRHRLVDVSTVIETFHFNDEYNVRRPEERKKKR